MASSNSSSSQEPKVKKTRGTTSLKDLETLLDIEFNERNQAVGERQSNFANYVGLTARSMISINIDSWKKVDQKEKDQYG